MRAVWVVDLDIRSFFDEGIGTMGTFWAAPDDPARGRQVVERHDGSGRRSRGTPQGGVISPLLSNLYLHHVLDEWFASRGSPGLHGPVRGDAVLAFEREEDARRDAVLGERFAKYGLRLQDKTRLRSPPRRSSTAEHHWGRSRNGAGQ